MRQVENNNYGVFCIATQLQQNNRELDIIWYEATILYNEFLVSTFNNIEKSELDCINEFLLEKKLYK